MFCKMKNILEGIAEKITDTFLLRAVLVIALSVTVYGGLKAKPAIDKELFPIYASFVVEMYLAHVAPATMIQSLEYVDKMADDSIGLCYYGSMRVQISRETEPDLVRRVVYHELGHCMLGMEHSADPTSLMYCKATLPVTHEMVVRMLNDYAKGNTYLGEEDVCKDPPKK